MDRQTERVKISEVCQFNNKNYLKSNFLRKESTSRAATGRTQRG